VEDEGEENEEELQKVLAKRKEDQLKQEQYQLIQTIENDPIAKKMAMEAGHKASKEALIQGLSQDEAMKLSREAMLFAL